MPVEIQLVALPDPQANGEAVGGAGRARDVQMDVAWKQHQRAGQRQPAARDARDVDQAAGGPAHGQARHRRRVFADERLRPCARRPDEAEIDRGLVGLHREIGA